MVRECMEESFGPKKMTKKSIVDSCKKNKLYITPHLNDILYLNYSGYNAIESLEEYVGLKCLWLECNAISEIKGLNNQTELRCLYLQNNLVTKIENLESCKQLDTLNLSHNHITKIENCGYDILPVLNTLNISHNYLKTADNLDQLRHCHFVSVLDLSHNRIEDIAIVKILGDMKELRVLTMTGNPVVNEIPSYRKTLILECKNLTYLDTRPVFDRDRACAEAWKRGGYEEEHKELRRWKREEERKIRRSINATLRMRHRGDGEPELLKTSSDEEQDIEPTASKGVKDFQSMLEINQKTNEQAWAEVETMFCTTSSATGSTEIFHRFTTSRETAADGDDFDEKDDEVDDNEGEKEPLAVETEFQPKKKLIEEIQPDDEEQNNTHDANENEGPLVEVDLLKPKSKPDEDQKPSLNDSTETDDCDSSMQTGKHPLEILKSLKTLIAEEPADGSPVSQRSCDTEPRTLIEEIDPSDVEEEQKEDVEQKPISKNMEKVISTEQEDDTLNVMIESSEGISITMESKEGELISKIESRPPSTECKKYKEVTLEEMNNSESEPTDITNDERECRSSSISVTSGTDSSDSEDMFDKIIPNKHPKLATNYSTTSTDSEDEPATSKFPTCLEKDKSIAECIDEYKNFFRAAKVLDTKSDEDSRCKIARPQTAKSKRTEPIIYEGVLKSMERSCNASKVKEAKVEAQESRERMIDRLIERQNSVDMNLEQQKISIGGQEHDFNEYRLQTFRKDQEKLQSLIDRVTAQKDLYNAHIDQIHDQLANIMEDYDQIGLKLKKVDDLIQNINEEPKVQDLRKPSSVFEEDIPEELEAELSSSSDEEPVVEECVAQQIIKKMVAEPEQNHADGSKSNSDQSSEDSSEEDLTEFIRPDHDLLELLASPKPVPILEPELKPDVVNEFTQDPVYQKFIAIQEEIDRLTEDELYDIVTEATDEFSQEAQVEQCLNSQVDQYWKQFDDIEDFRKNINLDFHPIIQKFRQFIRCHGEDDSSEANDTVVNLDKACRMLERRLSNQLFDEYLILSRKVSIATTGGESSATEIELIEVDEGAEERAVEVVEKTTAWVEPEYMDNCAEQEEEEEQGVLQDSSPQDLEDIESNPVGGNESGEPFFLKCVNNCDEN